MEKSLKDMTIEELKALQEELSTQMKMREENQKKIASEKISSLVQQAKNTIAEAEKIADEYNIPFDFSLAYGMGGTYYPVREDDYDNSDDYYEAGWNSSSSMC